MAKKINQKQIGRNVTNRIVGSMAERAASGNLNFAGKAATDKLIKNYRKALLLQKKYK